MNLIEEFIFQANNSTSNSLFREKEYSFDLDPLVLACSLKNLVDQGMGYRDLESQEVIDNINDDIRSLAENIRKYYGKKWMWLNLNSTALSGFRSRALYLIENRVSKNLNEKDKGIYFKLPFFYEEDMIYDDLKKLYNTEQVSSLGNKRSNVFAKRLTYIRHNLGTQKNRKTKYFWFHDDNNDLYSIHVKADNELLPMFEYILNSSKEHVFETRLTEDRIDKLHFYKLYSFKFLKV